MALRSSLLIAIPASIGLIFMGFPIIQTLLERGAFSPEATQTTVRTLQWYALGLASMCAVKVLANTLYALHDTWTPVRSAAVSLAANVAINFIIVWPMKLPGLALSTSISSTLNSVQLYLAVRRRIGRSEKRLRDWAFRVIVASLAMGLTAQGTWILGMRLFGPAGTLVSIAWLLTAVTAGGASFFGFGWLLGVEEIRQMVRWFLTKSPASNKN